MQPSKEKINRLILAGLYERFLDLRKGQHEIQKMASATRLALQEVPGFEDRYAEHWASESTQLDGHFDAVVQRIERLIQSLREDSEVDSNLDWDDFPHQ